MHNHRRHRRDPLLTDPLLPWLAASFALVLFFVCTIALECFAGPPSIPSIASTPSTKSTPTPARLAAIERRLAKLESRLAVTEKAIAATPTPPTVTTTHRDHWTPGWK